MAKIVWDKTGERIYETGVDRMVLYTYDKTQHSFTGGVAWNGITSYSDSPSGAEPTPMYADNIKYLNLMSAEEYAATLECYTYPDAFEECDGSKEIAPGVYIGQQNRSLFGLSYRSLLGDDVSGTSRGYKLHLVYNCLASPSERAHQTVNDSPEAANPSFSISTSPVEVTGGKPTATVVIDSTKVDAEALSAFEDILYGTENTPARLPLPDEVAAHFGGGLTNGILLNRHYVSIPKGRTVDLIASTTPADQTVTWTSGSDTTATVSSGTVTGKAAGNTIITASMTYSGVTYTDTCTVVVTAS